jgi:hypothetical protein
MPNNSHTVLCPAQQRAFDSLSTGIQVGSILRFRGGCGRGKFDEVFQLGARGFLAGECAEESGQVRSQFCVPNCPLDAHGCAVT